MQRAISNRLFAKLRSFVLICCLIATPSLAYAATDFTLISKTVGVNDATVKIKAKNPSQITSVNLVLNKHPLSVTSTMANGEFINDQQLASNGTFTEQFTSLEQGTRYSIRVIYRTPGYDSLKAEDVGDLTTRGTQLTPSPAYFATSRTTITKESLTVVALYNGSSTFSATVVAKNAATGVEAGRKTASITSSGETPITISGLTAGTTYNLVLTGTEQGSSATFQPVLYNGITTKTEATVVSTTDSATQQGQQQTQQPSGSNQCNDGIDNNGDGKADYYGVDTNGDGAIDLEPDPSCFSDAVKKTGLGRDGKPITEANDDVVSSIIPCTDKCTFTDVFRLLNQVLTFFIKDLLIPIFILIVIYAGYQYIAAEGNASKKANLVKILGNIVKGIVLILCAWLIVHTIMTAVLNDNFKEQGVEFLQNNK